MTTDVTEASPLAAATDVELLSFRIGENEYSVDIMAVREIRGWTRATSLPHSPSYVRGVINLRGAVLPVIDLALRLGLTVEDPSERNVIIVVDVDGRTIGLRVAAVSDILSFPKDELQDPPEAVPDLLKALHGGAHDVVFATRVGAYQSRRRMLFSRWFRFLVRRLTNLPVGAGGFLAMTSDVARTLRQKKSPRFYLTGLIGCGGYRITSIPVRRNHRPGGASSYSGRMRLSLGLTNLSVILQERFIRGQR